VDDVTLLPVDYEDRLPDGDIRKDKYELDHKKWCSKALWTADEAALISFSRDPAKVLNDGSLLSTEDEFHPEHVQLCNHINDLALLIGEAQQNKLLTTPVFLAQRFVEWATQLGVDFPPCVRAQVEATVEHDRRRLDLASEMIEHADQDEHAIGVSHHAVCRGPIDAIKPKARGPAVKLDDSLKKIILAMLLRHVGKGGPDNAEAAKNKLDNADLNAVAKPLSEMLKALDPTLHLSQRTIKDHLTSATDLLR
jgi:hypothetical protein